MNLAEGHKEKRTTTDDQSLASSDTVQSLDALEIQVLPKQSLDAFEFPEHPNNRKCFHCTRVFCSLGSSTEHIN